MRYYGKLTGVLSHSNRWRWRPARTSLSSSCRGPGWAGRSPWGLPACQLSPSSGCESLGCELTVIMRDWNTFLAWIHRLEWESWTPASLHWGRHGGWEAPRWPHSCPEWIWSCERPGWSWWPPWWCWAHMMMRRGRRMLTFLVFCGELSSEPVEMFS